MLTNDFPVKITILVCRALKSLKTKFFLQKNNIFVRIHGQDMVEIENVDVNISWIFTNSCLCGFLGFGRVFQEKT